MGQSTNGFEFFQGHHITAPVPVDTRIIVDTVAHLTDNNYWEKNGAFLYKGLLVTVTGDTESNNGAYYISKLGTNPSTTVWAKLGNNADLVSHATNTSNPHQVTKAQVGLGSVTDDPQVKRVEMGAADGVATLDSNKHVLDSQLGVEVHNVVEVYATYDLVNGAPTNIKLFEDSAHNTEVATPVKNRLYVDITSGSSMQFIWTGSGKSYKAVGSPVVLGEDSNSAYPGNKGKELADNFNSHQGNTSNPHHVTKDQVGLGNVDNTSDMNKPVSTAQAAAIKVVQDDVTTHENNESNPHKVTKDQVGLGNVDNTSDINKPVSTAQAAAIKVVQDKVDTLDWYVGE